MITGSQSKAAEKLNIPITTLNTWTKEEWWESAMVSLRNEKTLEHRQRYASLVDKAIDQVEARIGDASAKDAAVISGVAFDKVRLIDNMPTSISGSGAAQEAMSKLINEFKQVSDSYQERQVRVVSVQDGGQGQIGSDDDSDNPESPDNTE